MPAPYGGVNKYFGGSIMNGKRNGNGNGHRNGYGNGNGCRREIVSLWDLFDEITRNIDDVFSEETERFTNVIPTSFPPTNFYVDDEKNLLFEFALAGYSKDEIDLNFDGDKMYLTLTPIKEEESEHIKTLNKGIKHSSSKTYYIVPAVKYNHSAAHAEYKDGILKVAIPSREEAKPKKLDVKIL